MSELIPITALGAALPRLASFGALEIRENVGLALASLALRRGTIGPRPFGLTLPGPGRWIAGQGVAALWTGPDQWMIEYEGRADLGFAAELKQFAAGCSVTEQTDGWVAFEIVLRAGSRPLEALLSKLVNIDLADFGPGRARRTGIEHMSCFVIRRSEAHVAVLGARSSAASLWHALETAAKRLERK
ncbi:MAG: sarcosine oxidase subunit gamma [Mesorhizobium sp.]|uniref:sarcosine oxidase subunit gamma n=1 Tax=Mesorhizobium sp. TaxID=1871066 RepID=UPI000FCC0CEA|nr:sarcosine oxidase subunit gamma [Mesorhizobium sp.]RUW03123.1 sarcosine oxidase subunit gamma [Mesorhizobium sp. M1A.F.Ca.IN.020.04.1.1]RUW16278.1 sarcosine oxidase subunit gamma [Mesorhizobium sp. M1A.F.Ca.IN.020.03.1.1]RWF75931.1 MAG: sarcosine oxidase subunit gamma [Mesorhizobium sp.]RWG17286.1 MAG: sarcosine oxidase subunit gamma [Mesorhizobium sp.]RWG31805.1 MAG: sarcosine oxidase subunit gamma [Mesorhizobium sp.]